MIETIIIIVLFVVALTYLVNKFYQQFKEDAPCGGCASSGCSTIDFKKIEREIGGDQL